MEKKEEVTRLLKSAKKNHYSSLIAESNDQKQLFKVVNELTSNKTENVLPEHTSPQELANRFAYFFDIKIANIRAKLDKQQNSSPLPIPDTDILCLPTVWDEFAISSQEEIRKIVMKSKATTC